MMKMKTTAKTKKIKAEYGENIVLMSESRVQILSVAGWARYPGVLEAVTSAGTIEYQPTVDKNSCEFAWQW